MEQENKKDHSLTLSILASSIILASSWIYTEFGVAPERRTGFVATEQKKQVSELKTIVLPSQGVELPIVWGDLGKKLVDDGMIDAAKFRAIYEQRGTFTKEYENLLTGTDNGRLKITNENSGYLLNLFWALGLGNKNDILENGEMSDPKYDGAGNFASTGGWTIAKGKAMDHYSRHTYFNLTPEQQALLDKISRGVYRPCCGNSTHFPDCNHGMAMLGFLELMASQGVSEQDMWKAALTVNSYWFPDTYIAIATYMKEKKGVKWSDVNPQEILGSSYSSSSGSRKVSSQVIAPNSSINASGCGVEDGSSTEPAPVQQERQQSGCGI